MREMQIKYNVDRKTISNLWRPAKAKRLLGLPIATASKIKGKRGRPSIVFPYEEIGKIDQWKRTTLKKLAFQINNSYGTVQRWGKKGWLKSHSNAIKPYLSNDHKILRLNFIMGKIFFDQLIKSIKLKDMGNQIHIDEKWFHLQKVNQKFWLLPSEEEPLRTCQSKRHITKVMFMCAVARPQYAPDGECIFDGKLGIWPFTYQQQAQRSSVNRPAGTWITKAIDSITKPITKDMLLNNVIPAIKAKWPQHMSTTIDMQQDNAPPHIKGDDPDFVAAATSDGFNITLNQQPAQSPNVNILDLGFFNSIQSMQDKHLVKTIDELVCNVTKAYDDLEPSTLDNVWLSLQGCMIEIMKKRGHNNYPLPHLKKATLESQGLLPRDLSANEELVRECIQFLLTVGKTCNLGELMTELGIPFPLTMTG